jgi:hypothetical protein
MSQAQPLPTIVAPIKDLFKNMKCKQDFKVDWIETTKDDWKEDFALTSPEPVSNP